MAARGTLSFQMDKDELDALDGFIQRVNIETKTDRYVGPLLQAVHARMSDDFNYHMDNLARATARPEDDKASPFHHVYEWEMLGVPAGRLWSNRLEGHGANRFATFNWRASKRTVPVPPDELGPNAGERAFRRIHIFVWKAMVMEFKSQVKIEAKSRAYGGRGWLGWESDGPKSKDGLEFSRGPIYINPGGGNTVGSFTAAFGQWWGGGGAEVAFNKGMRVELEKNFVRGAEAALRGTRVRKKSMSITARKGSMQARGIGPGFRAGEAAAERFLDSQVRDYYAQARARIDNLNGGEDE